MTKTDNETFFYTKFSKPRPRLFSETKFFRNQYFFRDQIFQNRNWDFFPRPNFSETETETFFPRPNCPKPKPKPSKIWQKSRDRDLNRDFSTSFEMKFGKFWTYKQNWNFLDQNLGLEWLTESKLSPLDNIVRKQALSESIHIWTFPLGKELTMTNTIIFKITCFLLLITVLLIKDILDLA